MNNNYNLFTDFVALAVMAGIEKSQTEKDTAEKSNSEKKCECKCKNQQDFNNELLEEVCRFRGNLINKYQSINEYTSFLCYIENKLRAEIEKADTENSSQYTKKHCKNTEPKKDKVEILHDIDECIKSIASFGGSTDYILDTLMNARQYIA